MPEEFKMTVNEYMPLRDVVFHTLRQAILKGEMEPGERLMEIQLAKKLGVSRTPIREAIRKLELEDLAVELAVERMDADDIERLESARVSFREAVDAKDMIRIAQADELFHDSIYAGTYNDKLVQMLNNLRDQMYRYRLEYIKDTGKRQILLHEHEQILTAVKTRNIELARRTMREHIDNQELTISKKLSMELLEKKSEKRKEAKKR